MSDEQQARASTTFLCWWYGVVGFLCGVIVGIVLTAALVR